MKNFNYLAVLFICSLVGVGCSKKESPEPQLEWLGEWVNKENPEDILIFESEKISRMDVVQKGFNHQYVYVINGDSISLKYKGGYYVLVPEMKFRFILNATKDQIEIRHLNTYFPHYKGDTFVRKDQ